MTQTTAPYDILTYDQSRLCVVSNIPATLTDLSVRSLRARMAPELDASVLWPSASEEDLKLPGNVAERCMAMLLGHLVNPGDNSTFSGIDHEDEYRAGIAAM